MITIERTQYFEKWFKSLKDRIAKAKILIRVERMEEGNFGDVEPVGGGGFGTQNRLRARLSCLLC